MTPLPVVQPEAIASHADMFRCEPYRVNLTARACAGRQADAREAWYPVARPSPDPASPRKGGR